MKGHLSLPSGGCNAQKKGVARTADARSIYLGQVISAHNEIWAESFVQSRESRGKKKERKLRPMAAEEEVEWGKTGLYFVWDIHLLFAGRWSHMRGRPSA